MAWRKSKTSPAGGPDALENVLGRSSTSRGDLKADGGFRIDGRLEGAVESKAAVVVGESGVVHGDIRARDVVIAGQVQGNVVATEHVQILATGRVDGDVEAQSLRVEDGAVFRGQSRVGEAENVAVEDVTDKPSRRLAVS